MSKPRRKSGGKRPAVFLDRDGTLIHDMEYLSHPSQVRLFKGAAEAVRKLREGGYRVLVVTNQSGVARGYFPESSVRQAHRKLQSLLKAQGTRVDGFFYCPHHPEGTVKSYRRVCSCRKPKPGMVSQAVRKFPTDLAGSFSLGDTTRDVVLAKRAGLKEGLLVLTGMGKVCRKQLRKEGKRVRAFPGILQAARWILKQSSGSPQRRQGVKKVMAC